MVQKAVPAEKIDELMKRYGCTQEEAVQAWLEAETAYQETVENSLGATAEEKERVRKGPAVKSPGEIKEHLDKYVIGQEVYKKRLAIAAAYHFAMVKARHEAGDLLAGFNVKRFRKKNTLIAGPSGSGKTYCVEVLADLLGIPVNIVDATDYTESGYVGKSADDMIRELISLAPGGSRREKVDFINRFGGLIFIDELDKKAKEGHRAGADISREGFQRAVLKLIERKSVSINDPNSPASQIQELIDQQRGVKGGKKESLISTENILFVLGGSFQRPHDSMEELVKKRLDRKSGKLREDGSLAISGFTSGSREPARDKYRNYFKDAVEDDYIRFGIIPELVGRTPIRTYVNPLSKNDLVRIMTETKDSILEQYRLEFRLFDIEMEFTPEAINFVAEKAEKRKTGARALVSEWETILTEFQFELPGKSLKHFTVTSDICLRPQDELLKLLEISPLFDFIERFNHEHGVQLRFSDEAVQYVENYAREHEIQVSDALEKLMAGAPALNYMDIQGEFLVEPFMLGDEKYFDNLYVEWHQRRLTKRAQAE